LPVIIVTRNLQVAAILNSIFRFISNPRDAVISNAYLMAAPKAICIRVV